MSTEGRSIFRRSDHDPELKEKLRNALLTMPEDPEGNKALRECGARKFIATTESDFHSLSDSMSTLNSGVHARNVTMIP